MAGELRDALLLYVERCLDRARDAPTPDDRAGWLDELDGAIALLGAIAQPGTAADIPPRLSAALLALLADGLSQ
jgi:hypothetical protein